MADDIAEQRRKLAAAVRDAHAKYAAVAIKMPSKREGRANELNRQLQLLQDDIKTAEANLKALDEEPPPPST
jgi:predicted  nucleic acid-binding Zn-ribbon protein